MRERRIPRSARLFVALKNGVLEMRARFVAGALLLVSGLATAQEASPVGRSSTVADVAQRFERPLLLSGESARRLDDRFVARQEVGEALLEPQ